MTPLADLFPTEAQLPSSVRLPPYLEQREYLVGGELKTWEGDLSPVRSPVFLRTPEGLQQRVLGATPQLTSKESLAALAAAVKAYDSGRGVWPTMKVAERIEAVERFLVAMRAQRATVVNLLMWEIGKTQPDSEKEFDRTVDLIVETVRALKELDRTSSRFVQDQGIMAQIRRAPMGVALCMGPYNYPLNETFSTLFPALLMGNTVVFKPAKFGVLLIRPLLEAFRDCFPPGVINIIYGKGRETVGALMESGQVDLFAFIGTHRGASELKRMHPRPHRLKSVLGLDAKNPAIILEDADLDNAVKECIIGALSFNGQRCTALKLLVVHRSIAEVFLKKLTAAVDALKPGMPWEPGVAITPLPEPGKADYLQGLVDDAVAKGARVVNATGGQSSHSFFAPAVVYPVTRDMRLSSEEQFGPVVPVMVFDRDEEVIQLVVESQFGQQLSLFGQDPARIGRFIDAFSNQVGRINLNCQCQRGPDTFPFNGRKDSAEGTLSVADALRVFSIRTLVATKTTPANTHLVQSILTRRESDFLTTDFLF
ncbi:NADP-dependent glyceraldehyde-3-phosphate dehydrogenase [Myxococcus sp. MISCRS1]|uniref:NADP-dependent glyceraldehyde-3-phosphate dehydrogenase n=1 Tax=Myxococcus TaxID=32 RepID=UPI001CC15635|nr:MULTISPECIES: NADP-dependent glyceraldehyde-3-phosphate dehydrogenase [unclassified Myxococcus]MBZ4400686.1 NADP-dependent glyceraldehyde-3-phosphate dehydrogenase [Myxococcus sp. AS-1-15]MBZ4411062.1 NADP-dependent glyceraldehyde-3-phosphate dehydrogenase [Myxococcus sp. XM-1-1-1]MCY0996988.1 NADP-dependent glyceraldehyde-3-phosphate dehydrogenase [Myxococcus sp. MISCRS1]BDT32999.1 NADP-dependent glyceraldehyde-3-phosphate dehydrogenase [Myxococcus sp. MH1]